jgi:hypothetical protein
MELTGFGPHRQLCDDVELPKELPYHLAGIVSLAELFELRHDSRQRFFGLADGHVRIVLTLTLETRMMFKELLAVEIREALT